MHASWNALLKIRLEPFLAMTLINGAAGMLALPIIFFTGLPDPASYKWLAASALLHTAYNLLLAQAYRLADMSLVYPVARGTWPLLSSLGAVALLAELPLQHREQFDVGGIVGEVERAGRVVVEAALLDRKSVV